MKEKSIVKKLTSILVGMLCFSLLIGSAFSATWSYDSEYQPISKQEVAKIIRNPRSSAAEHELLMGRSGTSRLMEYAVSLYATECKKRPGEPLLQSAFCYAVFISQSGYTPSDKALLRRQHDTLWLPALATADETVRKTGAKIPFCWRVAAYPNIMGFGAGWQKGIEKAEKALALDPDDSYTLRLLAFAHLRNGLGDYNKAIAYARRAVQLSPKSSKGYSYLYLANANKKDYKTAFRFLQLSQRQMPPKNRNKEAYTTFKILAERQASGR